MITPSISFEDSKTPSLWAKLSIRDVQDLIRNDVAELNRARALQAEDLVAARAADRQPDYRLRNLVKAWEIAQDVHWSWYKELVNDRTAAANRPPGLGAEPVGPSY